MAASGLGLGLGDPLVDHFGGPPSLSISGGGPGGGSHSSNPLTELFPGGNPPTSPLQIREVVENHSLAATLQQGTILIWVQNVPGSTMPRLNTLSALPVRCADLYHTLVGLNQWAQWMPRFRQSSGTPAGRLGEQLHEVKTDGGMKTFQHRARFYHEESDGGAVCHWTLEQRGFRTDRGCTGLRKNDGTLTLVPLVAGEPETLMAYQIHIEPDVNRLLLATIKPIITRVTLNEFDQIVTAMANRSANSNWHRNSGTNPAGRRYHVQRV